MSDERYVFAEFGHSRPRESAAIERTKEVLAALRKEYNRERFVFRVDSIFITSTISEDVRTKCRAYCLGYAIAKGWRS